MLDSAKEALDDRKAEVDGLEHRIRAAQDEFEKTSQMAQTRKMNIDAQIEGLEMKLAKLRQGLTDTIQEMEQRELNTNLE
jgi:kinetochore protein NDC80